MVTHFVTKNVSAILEYIMLVKRLVHVNLIIGRLPSFMFHKSFDDKIKVARKKVGVNMVDHIIFLDTFWKTDRSLNIGFIIYSICSVSVRHLFVNR